MVAQFNPDYNIDLTWEKPNLPDFTHDIDGKELKYESNTYLRQANTSLALTPEHIQEIMRCAASLEYFLNNYVKIIHLDLGLIYFDINSRPYQRAFLRNLQANRHTCSKLPRQSGKTTLVCGYLLWYALFNPQKFVMILSYKLDNAAEILYKVQIMYQYIPKWLQQGIVGWGKRFINLENGTRFKIESTSKASAVGSSINLLVLDEFAVIQPHIAEKFMISSIPTITASQESKIMIISTPRGMNHFYKLFTEDNDFASFEIAWDEVPGRDEAFRENMIQTWGEEFWNQEFATEFLGSSNTLIHSRKLKQLAVSKPIEVGFNGKLKIYEKPIEGHMYAIGVDSSQGVGNDFHAFEVFDVTEYPVRQVATFDHNDMKIALFAELIKEIGLSYNTAMLVVENNNTGIEVANRLYDEMNYENLLRWSHNKSKSNHYGVNMNKVSKILACQRFKEILEGDKMIIHDEELIKQIKTFVSQGSNRGYAAEKGYHDDKVMAAVLVAFFLSLENYAHFIDDNPASFSQSVLERDMKQFIENSANLFGVVDSDFTYVNQLALRREHLKYFMKIEVEEKNSEWEKPGVVNLSKRNEKEEEKPKVKYGHWLLDD